MFVLAACGGGSSDDGTTPTPDTPQTMTFEDESLTESSADTAAAAAPASPVDSDDAPTWAPWVRAAIGAHRSAFAHCYAQLLAASPGAQGRVILDFVTHPDGSIGAVTVSNSTFPTMTPEFDGCLNAATSALTFVPSTEPVHVQYPLAFMPGEPAPPPSTSTSAPSTTSP